MKIDFTEREVNLIYNLVVQKRQHYGLIKQQWFTDFKEYIRTLNSLLKKLK